MKYYKLPYDRVLGYAKGFSKFSGYKYLSFWKSNINNSYSNQIRGVWLKHFIFISSLWLLCLVFYETQESMFMMLKWGNAKSVETYSSSASASFRIQTSLI